VCGRVVERTTRSGQPSNRCARARVREPRRRDACFRPWTHQSLRSTSSFRPRVTRLQATIVRSLNSSDNALQAREAHLDRLSPTRDESYPIESRSSDDGCGWTKRAHPGAPVWGVPGSTTGRASGATAWGFRMRPSARPKRLESIRGKLPTARSFCISMLMRWPPGRLTEVPPAEVVHRPRMP